MLRTALLFFLLLGPLMANEGLKTLQTNLQQLGAGSYHERKTAKDAIYHLASEDLENVLRELIKIYRASDDPENRMGARDVIEDIYRTFELEEGSLYTGLKLGWFIQHDGKKPSSLPMVLEVDRESPAAEAGFKPGDVITHFQGKATLGINSRNVLVRKLLYAKAGTTIKLQVKYSGAKGAFARYHKNKKAERLLTPIHRKADIILREFDDKAFKIWIKNQTGIQL